jgi:hypothetical protein
MHYKRWRRHGNVGSPERLIRNPEYHGKKGTKVYRAWNAMLTRCYNINYPNYSRYGGRGIFVCKEWRTSFIQFFRDMGDPPGAQYQLDRIDNNIGYSKENCHWVTPAENTRNRSNVRLDEFQVIEIRKMKKEGVSTRELVRRFGVSTSTINFIANGNRWKEVVPVL